MDNRFLYFIDILHRKIEQNGLICETSSQNWSSFVKDVKSRKLVCYGAGQVYSYFADCYGKQFDISYVVDEKSSEKFNDIDGVEVKKLKDIVMDKEPRIVLITVVSSIDSIVNNLIMEGIAPEDIYILPKMECEKEDIKKKLDRSFEDELFFQLCEISYQNFLETRRLRRENIILRRRFEELLKFTLHTNYVLNAVIDRLDDNEELKKEQIREKFVSIHRNNYFPDFNNPKKFNEKLLTMSLEMDKDPIYAEVTDKYTFKEYVSKRIGEKYVVPLLGVWNSPEEVDFNLLPKRFAIKASNGGDSAKVILIEDKNTVDVESIRQSMSRWTNPYDSVYYYNFNGSYKNVACRIIAEELLNISGLSIFDYKIHCFNGTPRLVHVVKQHPHMVSVFTPEWEQVDYSFGYPLIDEIVERPDEMDEMLRISKVLAEPFKYVRVDFYLVDKKIYVGELTLTQMGGLAKIDPECWDVKLGEMIE